MRGRLKNEQLFKKLVNRFCFAVSRFGGLPIVRKADNAVISSTGARNQKMNNHKDDGTFLTGVIMTLLMMASAVGGYWVRDIGITFKVQAPQVQRGVK